MFRIELDSKLYTLSDDIYFLDEGIYYTVEDGHLFPNKWDQSEEAKPALSISRQFDFIDNLKSALYRRGKFENINQLQIDAMQAHLDDLRKLVFRETKDVE